MKTLNESFTEEEWAKLLVAKINSGLNWHDFLLEVADNYNPKMWIVIPTPKEAKPE
jgi:hypothetical protein